MTERKSSADLLGLPALDPTDEERLMMALRHAFSASEIDDERHERLLQAALEDPYAPASPEEMVESERLRRALEGDGEGDHIDLALARALSLAHAPRPLAPHALARATLPAIGRRVKVRYLRFGEVAAALAVAAAVVLSLSSADRRAPVPDLQALALVQSRSTAPLFPALAAGAPSSRIDRIASVRARELRENRFAQWGVR